jgi:hypothetical protein
MASAISELSYFRGPCIPISDAPLCRPGLQLAHAINHFVHTHIPVMWNNLDHSRLEPGENPNSPKTILKYLRRYIEVFSSIDDADYKKIDRVDVSSAEKLAILYQIAQCVLRTSPSVGTCREMCALGFNQFKTKGRLEMFDIENGGHVFLVIDRDPASRPEEYQHWGPQAVVCDPWANVICIRPA